MAERDDLWHAYEQTPVGLIEHYFHLGDDKPLCHTLWLSARNVFMADQISPRAPAATCGWCADKARD